MVQTSLCSGSIVAGKGGQSALAMIHLAAFPPSSVVAFSPNNMLEVPALNIAGASVTHQRNVCVGQPTRTARVFLHCSEGSNVVDCGHSYCFGRSRSGGPLRVFGTGLPNGRTEFPIGRSIGRTPIGKVRTTIKKVRYPTGKVRGQIVPKPPSIQAESA